MLQEVTGVSKMLRDCLFLFIVHAVVKFQSRMHYNLWYDLSSSIHQSSLANKFN